MQSMLLPLCLLWYELSQWQLRLCCPLQGVVWTVVRWALIHSLLSSRQLVATVQTASISVCEPRPLNLNNTTQDESTKGSDTERQSRRSRHTRKTRATSAQGRWASGWCVPDLKTYRWNFGVRAMVLTKGQFIFTGLMGQKNSMKTTKIV